MAKAAANRLTAELGCGFRNLAAVEVSSDLRPDDSLVLYCQVAAWVFGALAVIAVVWFLVRPMVEG